MLLTVILDVSGVKQLSRSSSNKKVGRVARPTSPKSPVLSGSAFESIEGSEEDENVPNDSKLDNTYLHMNGNLVSSIINYCRLLSC